MSRLRVLTFGAGAIGTYIGGSLALNGHNVVFVERPGVAKELRKSGLRLDLRMSQMEGHEQPLRLNPDAFIACASLAEAIDHAPFDIAIFALKSFDTAIALEEMKPYADRLPPILCLQNGVENEPAIASALGAQKVISGTVTSSIGRLAAGDVVLERLRGIGIAAGHRLAPALTTALDEAKLNARLFPRAADMKWSKMLTNLLTNATSAILNMTPAEIVSHNGLFDLEMAMLREALAVMKAQGIDVIDLPKTPVKALALSTRLPAPISRPLVSRAVSGGRGGKMPSFHIDLHSGRGKNEVDWLNGAVVRFGKRCNLPTPVNLLLNNTLIALTHGKIPLKQYLHQPDRLLRELRSK